MVKDNLDLVVKDKEECVILILIMILMTMMSMLDIKEDLFIENLVVDLKDVDMDKVDLAGKVDASTSWQKQRGSGCER